MKKLFILLLLFFLTNIVFAELTENTDNTEVNNKINNDIEDKIDEMMMDFSSDKDINSSISIKDVNVLNKANTTTIRILNKTTAKSYTKTIKINETIIFDNRLIITPLFCWKSSPNEIPENKVLIKINEITLKKKRQELFYGWLFSSNPGINSVEHQTYDVTVINCE